MARNVSNRAALTFRDVNRRGLPGYEPGLQRHHLLPRQLLGTRCFGRMFDSIGLDRVGFEDFRANGLLLPASDAAALRMGLPLHRGPHRSYNTMVIERVGRIEAGWASRRSRGAERAREEVVMRLGLLQRALRRRLLDPVRQRFALNRSDPLGHRVDFSELDAMADLLWGATADAF